MFWVVAATVFSLWPGLLTSSWLDDYSGVSRATFEIYTFVTVAVLIGIAVVFWAVGRGHAIHTQPIQPVGGITPAPAGAMGNCSFVRIRKRGDRLPRSPRPLSE